MEIPAAAGAIPGEWAAGPGMYRPFCCTGTGYHRKLPEKVKKILTYDEI